MISKTKQSKHIPSSTKPLIMKCINKENLTSKNYRNNFPNKWSKS